MFDSIKAAAKSLGTGMVDEHVRPVIQSRASSELTTLRSNSDTMLPEILKNVILAKTNGNPAMAAVSKLLISRLDPFLASFSSSFKPIFEKGTEGLDVRVTDVAMDKIKMALHLIPEKSEDLKVHELRGQWPEISSEGFVRSIHERVRRVNEHVLAHILQSLPPLFRQQFTDKVLNSSVTESSSSGGGLGGFLQQMVSSQTNLLDSVTDQLWGHVQSPMVEGLISLLSKFETNVLSTISTEANKIPGLKL